MKNYKVTVNGTAYEITVEVADAASVSAAPKATEAKAPAAAPTPAPAAAPAGGEKVNCPMPGTILDVKVKVGDIVKEGDVLMILEAMKMENEIMAPVSGTIASVDVAKSSSVESGAVLCVIA